MVDMVAAGRCGAGVLQGGLDYSIARKCVDDAFFSFSRLRETVPEADEGKL
jgi:hypothetical protein